MAGRRHDAKGRSTGSLTGSRLRKANGPPADQPWCWLSRDLLESAAWRAMTANARRLIDRVMLEHMAHGGAENGALPVTYDDLKAWGVRRNSIAPTIAEAAALGLITHQPGRAAHVAGRGHPQTFRLAWLPDRDGGPALEGWRRFGTVAEAVEVGDAARAQGVDGRYRAKSAG